MGSLAHMQLILKAATHVARALVQIHGKGVAHLDLKVTAHPAHLRLERLQLCCCWPHSCATGSDHMGTC